MKSTLLLLISLFLSSSGLWAQQPTSAPPAPAAAPAAAPTVLGQVNTTWPHIQYQISQVQRIAGDRLVVFVQIAATADAPPAGTFIGLEVPVPKVPIPKNGPAMPPQPLVQTVPFSIESAVMTDEATQQTYSTVKPAPGGPNYASGAIITTLQPGESELMTIQFPAPPAPAPVGGGVPRQTVSLQLPNAVGPITKLVIPPAIPAANP